MKKTFIFGLVFMLFSQTIAQSIMDGDVGSSPFGLFKKASMLQSASATADDVIGAEESIEALIEDPEAALIDAIPGVVLPYTNSKKSIIASIEAALKKVDDALGKAAKRVDLWRTTKPTLVAYYKSARRLVDDTRDLMQEFTWAKLVDPKRSWDKKREKLFDADKNGANWRGKYVSLYTSFSGYLMGFVDVKDTAASKKEIEKIRSNIKATFVPKVDGDEILYVMDKDGGFDTAKIPNWQSRLLPLRTLNYSSDAIYALMMLEMDYYGKDTSGRGDTLTLSRNCLDKVEKALSNTGQTLVDGMELSGFLALQRSIVKQQTVRIGQLHTQLDVMKSNLYNKDQVERQEAAMTYEQSLQVLIAGKEKYLEYMEALAKNAERGL